MVVKNILLAGFGDITLLDLDTIDLSNLNRQFLFRKKDVKQSKAMVAARSAAMFNPSCKITPIHANIKEERFDVLWFQSFDIVLNALDNLDARRHVNKMCMAAGVPLIESGTAGYLGQVQPLLKARLVTQDVTECFDCMPKETPRTFPVCTIRSTPSTPIHCIVWAKSYLLPQLFGEAEDDDSELDQATSQGENAAEIAKLREEAAAFSHVRQALLNSSPEEAAALVFRKVFGDDIKRLLSMSDMWRARKPPVPLDRHQILSGTFEAPEVPASTNTDGSGEIIKTNGVSNMGASAARSSGAKLKDQRQLTLKDSLVLFDDSLSRLSRRLRSGKETSISFDKDDDDTLDFVTATANLRATSYSIEQKTRWEVKEMAGNIIPAIATTNAVISGLIVLQALHIIRAKASMTQDQSDVQMSEATGNHPWSIASSSNATGVRDVFLQVGKPNIPLGTFFVSPPNAFCGVCRDTYVVLRCDPARVTLGEVLRAALRAEKSVDTDGAMDEDEDGDAYREVSIYEGTRMLGDPDWDDNHDRTLESLGCGRGKFLTLVDEDGAFESLVLCIALLPGGTTADSSAFILPSPFPPPKPRARPKLPPAVAVDAPTPSATSSRKRSAPEDDLPPAKRTKVDQDGPSETNGVATVMEGGTEFILLSEDDEEVMEIL
ncbi:E1 ubiquitin-activating protein uba2 [Tulasnella sp. 403]|nr:E1 ubiquitin-activating protein uba2 [Tulasnella sp. 403]